MLDTLIIGGTVIDGSGKKGYLGTVGIKDGVLIMDPKETEAKEVIDATGKIVCPGFIDPHSHGDALVGTEDGRLFKTPQGITTELAGNCGGSRAPIPEFGRKSIYEGLKFGWPREITDQWTTFDKFLSFVEASDLSANARFYVGHNILRFAVMGFDNRPSTEKELDQMKGLLRESMQSGAAGFSTGLIYLPGCYSEPEEVEALASVVAEYGGIYSSHIRNEAENVIESVQEVLDVGRKTGVRLNISHHKVQGRDNWGKQNTTLKMVDEANANGIYTTLDLYPYTRSMNGMKSCMPPWHFSEGINIVIERLRDPEYRKLVKKEMMSPESKYDNFYRNSGGWEGVYIAAAPKTPEAEGYFIADYAKKLGKDPFDTYFDLQIENDFQLKGVYCTMNMADVCQIVKSPYCVIGTDGCTPSWKNKGHPRASAAFPQAIQTFVKDEKIFTLEEMIHKMTGLTAERLLVKNKGLLKDGYDADVLVLDFDGMKVHSTYDDPNRKTEGIDYVFVGGKCVYHDLEFTGNYTGKVLRFGK